MKTLKIFVIVAVTILVGGLANAQSSKYQRPGKKTVDPAIAPVAKDSKDSKATDTKTDTKSEKVDIQQIENEYWQSKDTEFHVVQNRKFAKEKRPFVSLGYGLLVNDSFNRGGAIAASGGYYYKEQTGFEISYMSFSAKNSKTVDEIFKLTGAPTYAHPLAQYGATWNWMPIYGKISLFDSSIIYFDMGIHMGLGIAEYERVVDTGKEKDSTPMVIFDISQQFFMSEKWALRFDVKNRFYKQDLKKYRAPYTTKSDTEHNIDATLGLIYYFK
jgi:outer membrane beta-barrel protein